MATAVNVASGQSVSSAFALQRPTFAVALPHSATGAAVRIQYATALDAASASFLTLQGDGTGAPLTVLSGGGFMVSAPIPAVMPFARLFLATANTVPSSFVVLPLTVP